MNWVRKVFILVFGVVGTTGAFAQNLSQHNWYFGNTNNGIRFNRATNLPALVTNKAIPFGTGGSAVATNPATADLFFYTDGNTIFDLTHTPMPNGSGLSGLSSANQPVAVCAVPGQPDKYFVFTNNASFTTGGTISVSIVDMKLFGNSVFPSPPFGDVTNPKNTAVPGLTNRSEGMAIVPHANGTDFWLITHQNSSPTYAATLINAASFTGTFNTSTTSVGVYPLSVANFSYFARTKKMAVAPQDPGTDAVILTFNDTAGTFTFDSYILNSGKPTVTGQSIYDIQWDQKGRYLYLSRFGEPGIPADLLQYDTQDPTITLTSVLTTPVFRSFGLQLAPDSSIYYLYQESAGGLFLVDTFTKTDTIAAFVKRNRTPLGIVNFNGTQFPAFLPHANPNLVADFTFAGTCQNNPTTFYPTVTPNADSLRWQFGDGVDTVLWSPVHTYGQAQAFNVTMTAYYQGDSVQVTHPVSITAFAIQLTLVQDTTACRSEFPAPRGTSTKPNSFHVKVKATGGSPTYAWSNGDVGDTVYPDSAGYYFVVATDGASGCSTYAGVNVKEYGLQDQRRNIWQFGNHAGIDFNVAPPKALNNSAMDAPEGCAIVCDRNGQTIFYTDGDRVWDRTDTQIDAGIGGDPLSTQSAIIIPVPGDETLYYIFTTQAIDGTSLNEMRFSLFDLKQNAGKGAITQKNVPLYSKSTERLTGNARWVISHEFGNNTFRAYPVTNAGIGVPVYSAIGSDHSLQFQQNGEGYMKLGPQNVLAVALSTPGSSNIVELFHFNDSTGVLTNYHKIDLNEPSGQVYGVEFSPGGNKLFASVKGSPSPSKLFEYSIDSLEVPHFKQVLTENAELGAIQLAPNMQVMVALNDAGHNGFLGTIAANDDTTALSSFQLNGFALAGGTTSRLGLPNFIQQVSNAFGGPGFSFTGICLGDSTHFNGVATDAIDQFQWTFGDGGGSSESSPVHLYASAGTYTVGMHLTNRCGLDTLISQKVTIFAPPAPPTVAPASALCNGPVSLNANTGNIPGLTYFWNTGDTTKIVVFNQPGFFDVTNTDQHGCHTTAQAIIADNRPQIDLSPDQVVCQNEAVPRLNGSNPLYTHVWTIDGVVVAGNNSQFQPVDTSNPGVFVYKDVITDPLTLCTASSQKTFTVNVSPSFVLTGTNPSSCGTPTGTVTLTLNSTVPAAGPYDYFITGVGGFNQQGIDNIAPSAIGPLAGASAGPVTAIVQDQVSGCTTSGTIGLTDATFTATATPQNSCDPVTLRIVVTGGVLPFTYTIVNNTTGQSITGPGVTATFDVVLPNQGPGATVQYTVSVKDNLGCTFSLPAPTPVTTGSPSVITVTPDLCAAPPTITATGASSYAWTTNVPGSIVGSPSGPTIQLLAGAGTVTYSVTATGVPGTCPVTEDITVDVNAAITPSFTQSDPCDDQVVLTATPVGNFTYRWFLDVGGVPQPTPLVGQQTIVTASGIYFVELTNVATGCRTMSSPSQAVSVIGKIEAGITAQPACDDNKPFKLTAVTNTANVTYQWYLNNSIISGATADTLLQTTAGNYKVEITKSTCTSTAQLNVFKFPVPVGNLPPHLVICNDPDNLDPKTSKADLDPGLFESYNWFKNQLTLGVVTRVYTADSEGIYSVELKNVYGCVGTDQTEISNECVPKVVAPTAFHPNGGVNENKDFYVFSFFITDSFQIFIYNRWGEMVYQSNDRRFKWNGTLNNAGQPLPGGTYAYIIKYVSSFEPQAGVQEKHGGVVLLR